MTSPASPRPTRRDRLSGWSVPSDGPAVRHLDEDPGLPSNLPSSVAWILTNYSVDGYEGSGEAVVGYVDGRAVIVDLGHCSCYDCWDNEPLQAEGTYTPPELAALLTGTAGQGRAGLLEAWGRSPFARMTEAGLAQLMSSPNATLRTYARQRGIPTIAQRRMDAGRTAALAEAREQAAAASAAREERKALRAAHRARRLAAALDARSDSPAVGPPARVSDPFVPPAPDATPALRSPKTPPTKGRRPGR